MLLALGTPTTEGLTKIGLSYDKKTQLQKLAGEYERLRPPCVSSGKEAGARVRLGGCACVQVRAHTHTPRPLPRPHTLQRMLLCDMAPLLRTGF